MVAANKSTLNKKSSGGSSSKKTPNHPLFEKTPKNFRLGGDIRPKSDLTRYVHYPRYILLQRQKSTILRRLKVPPALNQFTCTLDKNQASQLLRLMGKYKPETRLEKKARLQSEAQKLAAGEVLESKKPIFLKYGVNHVTDLIEMKKAKLVVIASDVDPIEIVCFLPALCRKKDVAFCILGGKARLGKLVGKKTAAVIAMEAVRKEDQAEFDMLCRNFMAQYNDNLELRRKWGGGIMGVKAQHVIRRKEKILAMEQAKKVGLVA
ncbi:60S ribosomal protein L7a, putative [Cryptosporidium muris RN66]|uniref:60S ribosomal protein L7a n=1 Tax=Cryptosporidium muris (strain RN66) TaxID=441375 RepID=B6AAM8_CRYMR|nr:60S ribosomal protein L7a, putative [Cryptosporidium muris RN66]EEA05430.1 60S ribosomal protein L7a, putative [Cryptosporidium muris RN66]|eukprot:XP_002139779.1 60S ribosomal protein L7a [Cryptosporidium muris RN66]